MLTLAILCFNTAAFASGNPNINNGGGGLKEGSSENFWNSGNDGVRVTVVDSETGEVRSPSIDLTNKNVSDIAFHFGKVSKTDYIGGTEISVKTSAYTFVNPAEPLPTIISDGSGANIDAIRDYFTDEQVVRGISNLVGIDFDELTGGDYKLLLEPIMYITYNGIRTAMTATEAALYNMRTGGDLIMKFGPLSHKNLPLAMFLEKDRIFRVERLENRVCDRQRYYPLSRHRHRIV